MVVDHVQDLDIRAVGEPAASDTWPSDPHGASVDASPSRSLAVATRLHQSARPHPRATRTHLSANRRDRGPAKPRPVDTARSPPPENASAKVSKKTPAATHADEHQPDTQNHANDINHHPSGNRAVDSGLDAIGEKIAPLNLLVEVLCRKQPPDQRLISHQPIGLGRGTIAQRW
jgi:hypothetical protein